METKARYTLMGLFTIGVIAAAFAFVFWLHRTGGLAERTIYRVNFQGPVSGLLVGSNVLFNGIRVGEITSLHLAPDDPRAVVATIGIDPAAPIRADTRVEIEFQGLTGAPVISLIGGKPGADKLQGTNAAPPVLTAPPDAGQSITAAARQTLGRFDTLLSENSKPLRETITSIGEFSQALARNSGKVDGILSGLERMTAGSAAKSKAPAFELSAMSRFGECTKRLEGQLVIPEPTALMSYNTEKIPAAGLTSSAPGIEEARWSDILPILVQTRLVQSFENFGCFRAVTRPLDELDANYRLLTEIRVFRADFSKAPAAAIVEISARAMAGKGRIVASKVFRETSPIERADPGIVARSLDRAFTVLMTEMIAWTANVLPEKPDSENGAQ